MDTTHPGVATIGDAEVDHAIATLVLAFVTDPVARWMYDNPHQYLLHIPRLFRALGKNSFEGGAAQRTDDGLGVALWLSPGVHGDDGPLEAVIAESIVEEKQAEVAALFEQTEHYWPTEPHWYLSLIGSKLCIGTRAVVRRCWTTAFGNAIGSTSQHTSGPQTRLIPPFTRGMALRSWAQFEWVRRLQSIPCCAVGASSADTSTLPD
jgi:hypothetical protein